MENTEKKVRVRFAPSPTGFLHVGGARTALFNWLYARKTGGVFILRIEDTDENRSTPESIKAIIEGMRWLGLNWDEGADLAGDGAMISNGDYGPYYQTQRVKLYNEYAQQLVKRGKAYPCFCSTEELEQMRKAAQDKKMLPKYDGRCRSISPETAAKRISAGENYVIRFKMPDTGSVEFDDLIRGHMAFENNLLDDFVIVKASGVPTYNYAVTIDDYCMKITHVIRGDDHISNTPRQLHLYKAFGWELPLFAHLPMILGPDGSRLSKRHGATAIEQYRDEGYLSEALVNYLALLGWSTEDSQQLFKLDELIQKFSLERVSKAAGIFDTQKLLWMNGEYLRALDPKITAERAKPWLEKAGISGADPEYTKKLISLEHEKYKLLSDVPKRIDYFLKDEIIYDESACAKHFNEQTKPVFIDLLDKFTHMEEFGVEMLEKTVREYAVEKNLKTSKIFHPIRVAVSGRTEGPGLFELLHMLGKEKVCKRLKIAVTKCGGSNEAK